MSIIGTKEIQAEIAQDANLSAAVELGGHSVERIIMPAAWDAADLTFQVSDDGGTTFQNLYWDWGAEMVVDAAQGLTIELSPFIKLSNIDQLKVRSGTSGVPVAQTAVGGTIVRLSVSTRG